MTDKELKRLRRSELLQMLLEQTVENEELREKTKKLEEELLNGCGRKRKNRKEEK